MSSEESALEAPPLIAADSTRKRRLPILPVAALLREQSTLTAVERFSQLHDSPDGLLKEPYYRDLLPLTAPGKGQQWAFEVDLDRCTGCKACVSACHTLNGLDDRELWRTVGLLHGGSPAAPTQQTITTSCHHCVEPACMQGCPTLAYEKDPKTGIVKHLDDQCFGCQYCTLMCPYDAPKYNASRGIVRKCDMCSDRLAHGEAPACVQACPNGAIAIRVVDQAAVVASSDAQRFLPGAPAPSHTLPTTNYKTARAWPTNMLPADFYSTRPEHAHTPLVIMLTFTQLSVGAFAVALLTERISAGAIGSAGAQAGIALGLALLALVASVFHLGRPWLAWRAVLGLRTSWLSREALAFGVFVQLASLYAACLAAPLWPELPYQAWLPKIAPALRQAAAVTGLLGVYCSVMVYVATRREQWSPMQTGVKFFGTSLLLGSATVFSVAACALSGSQGAAAPPRDLLWIIAAVAGVKLALEVHALTFVRDARSSALKRMAKVMLRELRTITAWRFGLLCFGGFLLPALALFDIVSTSSLGILSIVQLGVLLLAELGERYLYFRAAPASRMPGALK